MRFWGRGTAGCLPIEGLCACTSIVCVCAFVSKGKLADAGYIPVVMYDQCTLQALHASRIAFEETVFGSASPSLIGSLLQTRLGDNSRLHAPNCTHTRTHAHTHARAHI